MEQVFTILSGDSEFYADGSWSPMAVGEARLSLRGHRHAFRSVESTMEPVSIVTNDGDINECFRLISGLRVPEHTAELEGTIQDDDCDVLPSSRG